MNITVVWMYSLTVHLALSIKLNTGEEGVLYIQSCGLSYGASRTQHESDADYVLGQLYVRVPIQQ